ncbi:MULTISPECIES: hypothetical protein [unclassified Haladaptatus]|uniref:DUF7344 domain-containing protein n=1 Tax=unclassified Haladaptatus TaxID=2622732 RepID=UPI00209C06C9|nr:MULTISPECIES: hypothetical protein [unclassified Haladaptatus]MCO8245983.1 hypothetical protein [Haladaptatus sp. AB643]MCO8254397.1 hypothetical protein [Haladaptatus sp. AB618]
MDGDEHSLRALLQILAEPRRRYALYHLRRHDRTTVTRLADSVAGWMDAEQDEPLSGQEHVHIYTELHHTDIPRLVAAGIVHLHEDEERVKVVEFPEILSDLLDVTLEFDDGAM